MSIVVFVRLGLSPNFDINVCIYRVNWLSIEWNLIRLCGQVHGINQNCAQSFAGVKFCLFKMDHVQLYPVKSLSNL